MSKTVLLIESDLAFARDMSAALESRGFGVRTSSDGKEGVELARALLPDCVVLCVELPGLSGYSWCNRLKKDEALKKIPLVITSSEATPETFEQHRKLKTRAEDYLIKPFPPATLVDRIVGLIGMPDSAPPADEEMITLADVELDGPADGGAAAVEEDADLKMLDDAFDSISGGGGGDEPSTRAPGSPVSEPPLTLLPDADESPAILDLDREMAEALASLAEEAAAPARVAPLVPSPPPPRVRLVEPTIEPAEEVDETPILLEDVEVLPAVDVTDESSAVALQASQAEARSLRGEIEQLRGTVAGWEEAVGARDVELAAARARLESAEGSARKLAGDLEAAREAIRMAQERSSELERELGALRPRLAEAEQSASARGAEAIEAVDRAGALERALEESRSEVALARADAESLRADGDSLRSEIATLRSDGDALQSEVSTLRSDGDTLRSEVAALRTAGDSLRSEAESLRAEVASLGASGDSLRGEASQLASLVASLKAAAESQGNESAAFRSESESRVAGLARQLQALEAQVAQAEDRVLRAYQKIKSDEKMREKTRKALAMVIQVLEERSPGDGGAPPTTPER
jgi:CheY-like chemotaxis protein